MQRPQTILVLAMSIDGKIADVERSAARFSSKADRLHLERQLASVDAALFGAQTLRAYGTTLPISNPQLLQGRQQRGEPLNPSISSVPLQVRSIPNYVFSINPSPMVVDDPGGISIVAGQPEPIRANFTSRKLAATMKDLRGDGIEKLAILGGGELVASLIAEDLIDEFYLTLCPVILGEPMRQPQWGEGNLAAQAQSWELLGHERIENELFLNYQRIRPSS